MKRILDQVNELQNDILEVGSLNKADRERLEKTVGIVYEVVLQVQSDTVKTIGDWNTQFAKQNDELEELRRTREEYREHYEKRLKEKDEQISVFRKQLAKVEEEKTELYKLVINQAKFIGNTYNHF